MGSGPTYYGDVNRLRCSCGSPETPQFCDACKRVFCFDCLIGHRVTNTRREVVCRD